MMSTGIQLTIYGMGLVFLLLMALWGMMSLLLRLDRPPAAAKQVVNAPPAMLPSGDCQRPFAGRS